jgi:hypothetical protein
MISLMKIKKDLLPGFAGLTTLRLRLMQRGEQSERAAIF